jgi:hypothetical protein
MEVWEGKVEKEVIPEVTRCPKCNLFVLSEVEELCCPCEPPPNWKIAGKVTMGCTICGKKWGLGEEKTCLCNGRGD